MGRTINYMRISVTDRCNLRCRYCMPDGIPWIPMTEILTYEEIGLICRQAVVLGITRFKVTGGEPLVRRGCVDFIARLKRIPGVEQVTLTTNGILLQETLPGLLAAGLDAVNISLDTLNRETYRKITGFDGLDVVRSSVEAALRSGIRVKLNVVLQKGVNDAEWESLAALAKDRPLDVRFIELMPIGHGKDFAPVSNRWLEEQIRKRYPGVMEECPAYGKNPGADADARSRCGEKKSIPHGNGPGRYVRIPGFGGSIGFISALHGKFCDSCNRIRLTSTGKLKPCLCYADTVDVREAARRGDAEMVRRLITQAVEAKPRMHCFEERSEITEAQEMARIGG